VKTVRFSGVRLIDVPGFIAAQLIGAMSATVVFGWFFPHRLKPV
jgi:glycerol uptake facilitator-like aquaporin